MKKNHKIIIYLLISFCLFFISYHYQLTSWEKLKSLHIELLEYKQNHFIFTSLVFMGIYTLYAFFSLPGIFILSFVAGYLFVQPLSTLYVTVAATIGSIFFYLFLQSNLSHQHYVKSSKFLNKLEEGFKKNEAGYLLFLRWFPLFPFPLVNIAGAYFKVPFFTFIWTTFIGMIPSVFIYTEVGEGLAHLLESQQPPSPLHLLNKEFIVGSLGLCLLSLLPLILKKCTSYFDFDFLKNKN